jgi:NitT/TauT family transport system permease protein
MGLEANAEEMIARPAALVDQGAAREPTRLDGVRRRRPWFRGAGARLVPPVLVLLALMLCWHAAVRISASRIVPGPWQVAAGIAGLVQGGVLWRYAIASLYRVTVGFGLAVLVGVPAGLLCGWFIPLGRAFNPVIQLLRPISPIAWIPLAILWFGVDDRAPIFLIFVSTVFPLIVSAAAAVRRVPVVYVRAARNFGLHGAALFRRVIFPATLPALVTAVRVGLGIAWLVVVAAEMIAVDSGLGYLIVDARNAGGRYDLVVAGMVLIGIFGLLLDTAVRSIERLDAVRWGISDASEAG